VSTRSIALGLLLIPLNTGWIGTIEGVWHGLHMTCISLAMNVVFLLLPHRRPAVCGPGAWRLPVEVRFPALKLGFKPIDVSTVGLRKRVKEKADRAS
jgi:hypothetical protein